MRVVCRTRQNVVQELVDIQLSVIDVSPRTSTWTHSNGANRICGIQPRQHAQELGESLFCHSPTVVGVGSQDNFACE